MSTQNSPTRGTSRITVPDAIYFSIFTYRDVKYATTLTSTGITWTRFGETSPVRSVSYDDMLTVKRNKRNPSAFHIYYCTFPKKEDAKFCVATFISTAGPDEAATWIAVISNKLFGTQAGEKSRRRKMVAVINPFGGTKIATRIWQSIESMFRVCDIDVEVLKTERPGHATEFCMTTPLERFADGLFCVSGDGVLSECINGLLKRKDWKDACNIPIGIVPGGSGNGLAATMSASYPIRAAFAIVKGKTHPLDIWSVLHGKDRTFSFLSVEWAILAAVDFESEKARFLGGARFALWALKKIVDWDIHKGMLFYLPADDNAEEEHIPRIITTEVDEQSEDAASAAEIREPLVSSHSINATIDAIVSDELQNEANGALADDDTTVRVVGEIDNVDSKTDSVATPQPNPTEEFQQETAPSIEDKEKVTEDKHVVKSEAEAEPIDDQSATSDGPPLKHIPLTTNNLARWRGSAGDFIFFLAANVTHIAADANAAPRAQLADGKCDIVVVRRTSKASLTRFFLGFETGKHIEDPDVEYIKAKAFVLRPEARDGTILWGVDGEKMPPASLIQVEVHPSLMRVFYNPRPV